MLKKLFLFNASLVVIMTMMSVQASTLNLPVRGATMDGVANQLGQPQQKLDPVGQPPITRWVYTDYTLYFEYDRLLHAVTNETTKAEETQAKKEVKD